MPPSVHISSQHTVSWSAQCCTQKSQLYLHVFGWQEPIFRPTPCVFLSSAFCSHSPKIMEITCHANYHKCSATLTFRWVIVSTAQGTSRRSRKWKAVFFLAAFLRNVVIIWQRRKWGATCALTSFECPTSITASLHPPNTNFKVLQVFSPAPAPTHTYTSL